MLDGNYDTPSDTFPGLGSAVVLSGKKMETELYFSLTLIIPQILPINYKYYEL